MKIRNVQISLGNVIICYPVNNYKQFDVHNPIPFLLALFDDY